MRGLSEAESRRVEELLGMMTLDEKIGQMNLESPSIVGGFEVPFEELIEMMIDGRLSQEEFNHIMSNAKTDLHEDKIRSGQVGALMIEDPEQANAVQKIAVEESRLKIPLLIGYDVIHGLKSVYPIAIAEGGSFDRELMEKTAYMAAREARADGINWVFSPMIDVARDARWGRVSEGAGEDPYLLSEFARAKVRGFQGGRDCKVVSGCSDTGSKWENYVAACLKHYVGYGACEAGRDYNTTSIAPHLLFNMYLAPFKAAILEDAKSVMAAFNDMNGIPCTVNRHLIRDILKDNFGMDGPVVSDANAIAECVVHGIAGDECEAGQKAIVAGVDIDMGTEIYLKNLKELTESGQVSMDFIDEAVRRILSLKMWLGLFEHPYVAREAVRRIETISPENRNLCLRAAQESIVLLKNENGILPLSPQTRISLVGKLADSRDEVSGAWAMAYRTEDCVSIREGMQSEFPNLEYFPIGGPEENRQSPAGIHSATDKPHDSVQDSPSDEEANCQEMIRRAAEYGDVIVAVLGETKAMSGEASSRGDITLPGNERDFLAKLLETGKKVVLVLMNGRPLALDYEAENVPAIVEAWHLGIEMGNAVASVLCGKKNPEGKLSSTFPYSTGQCPIYYNHPNTGRPGSKSKFTSRYLDIPFEPLYPFGYGLSFTKYEYSGLTVADEGKELAVSVSVKNIGERDGRETVLFFTQDVSGSLVRPVKELKDFVKVELKSGEEKRVIVRLAKKRLGFWNNEGRYCLEDGVFRIYAGSNSRDNLMHEQSIKF